MTVTLETAKLYLRVDSSDEDALIEGMIASAQKICKDVLRADELPDSPEVDIAVFYALAYLYEHREEADHKEMMETLRAMLGAERKEVF
ncbi:MAG: phage gp6-like head-tail connector protein [Lachnospiraceae bacterium]|jgi:uncharacterized phage protein (predicted DNA packaging)|nr:phage gp6-like head-tail connector protein [Lachnospiraceae bacterium]